MGKLLLILNKLFPEPCSVSLFGSAVQPGFHQSCVAALFKCGSFELLIVHVKATATQLFLSHVLVVNVIVLKLYMQIKA